MDTIPEGLDIPLNGPNGDGLVVSGPGMLADARNKLAVALRAFSVAQSTVPGLQAALAAGRAPPSDDLFELDRVQSALAQAAEALGLDPDRATLAELEARLSTWERAIALRGALERLARNLFKGRIADAVRSVREINSIRRALTSRDDGV